MGERARAALQPPPVTFSAQGLTGSVVACKKSAVHTTPSQGPLAFV